MFSIVSSALFLLEILPPPDPWLFVCISPRDKLLPHARCPPTSAVEPVLLVQSKD